MLELAKYCMHALYRDLSNIFQGGERKKKRKRKTSKTIFSEKICTLLESRNALGYNPPLKQSQNEDQPTYQLPPGL